MYFPLQPSEQFNTFLIDLIDAQAACVLHFEIFEEALDGLPDAVELLLAS